jgi:hypothetical protein
MPHLFDRAALDALAAACNAPPAPWPEDEPILLSGRCHPGAPSTCRARPPGLVEAACADCGRPFAVLEVDLAGAGGRLPHHPECDPVHAADAVVLSYARSSGVVGVACARCGKLLGVLPVRRRGSAGAGSGAAETPTARPRASRAGPSARELKQRQDTTV